MIKVEYTKTITTYEDGIVKTTALVTDAKLVLVRVDNPICGLTGTIKGMKQCDPILISEREKIEVDDIGLQIYDAYLKKIIILTKDLFEIKHTKQYFKILALPEHFSPQQLQMIVDGKLKEGKWLLECEILPDLQSWSEKTNQCKNINLIKLNPHITGYDEENHPLNNKGQIINKQYITIYPVEEKMYTREEVAKLLGKFCIDGEISKTPFSDTWINKWFEQNVK